MPIYNGEWSLREAVASVLAQTHRDFELLVVDDGSTDGTPAILAELAAVDRWLRVIPQANGGGARARNRALQEARADWIINLDHDDVMLSNRIERQLTFIAAHPEVRAFSCRAYYMNARGKIFGKTKCERITTPAAFRRYLASNQPLGINHPAAALHRSTVVALGGYRPAFEGAEDLDLWNRLAEQGHVVLQQDEVLMKYRIHGGSMMASRTRHCWQKGEWAIACMAARRARRREPTWQEHVAEQRAQPRRYRVRQERELRARVSYRVAGFDIANRRWASALRHMLIAGAANPSYVAVRLANQLHLPGLSAARSSATLFKRPASS
jgi:glycosyltransferase involved in cell wall biosynthesis